MLGEAGQLVGEIFEVVEIGLQREFAGEFAFHETLHRGELRGYGIGRSGFGGSKIGCEDSGVELAGLIAQAAQEFILGLERGAIFREIGNFPRDAFWSRLRGHRLAEEALIKLPLHLHRGQALFERLHLGGSDLGVKKHKSLSSLHRVTFTHLRFLDDAANGGLHIAHRAAWFEFASCVDDLVDRRETGPEHGCNECADDGPHDRPRPEMRLTQNHGVGVRPQNMAQCGNRLDQSLKERPTLFHEFVLLRVHSSVRPPV